MCLNLYRHLFVLPPASPKYNGGVERSNRTFREEFYNRPDLLDDTISSMKKHRLNHLWPKIQVIMINVFNFGEKT
jgi:hypothetical protein